MKTDFVRFSIERVLVLFPEDGGRPPKHVGVKNVLFLYMLFMCIILVFINNKHFGMSV
jgi:hypothetical protein